MVKPPLLDFISFAVFPFPFSCHPSVSIFKKLVKFIEFLPTTICEIMTDTSANAEPQQEEDKSSDIMKCIGWYNWRRQIQTISFSNDALSTLNDRLHDFNWSLISDYELPTVIDVFPVNITTVHKIGRQKYGVSSVANRLRMANSLAWLASQTMKSAASTVNSQGRNRIMASDVTNAWNAVTAFVQNAKLTDNETKKKAKTVSETAPQDTPPSAPTPEEKNVSEKPPEPASVKEKKASETPPDPAPVTTQNATQNATQDIATKGPPKKKAKTATTIAV